MKNLTVRLLLTLVAIAALGAAGFQVWRLETDTRTAEEARRQIDDRLRALTLVIADARAQQQAYVAAGQGSAFWAAKVAQVLARFENETEELKPLLKAPAAQAALDEAAKAVDTFRKMDARAREYARAGEDLLASDLIFSDGFETTSAALAQLEAARVSEAARAEEDGRAHLRAQIQFAGGAVFICVLVLIALTPRAAGARAAAEDANVQITAVTAPIAADETKTLGPPPASPEPDLAAAADVCAGLARVLESSELSALLGRAAQIIDAAGLIVWIADRSGAELRPALAHGYSSQTLARMGAIPRDAHNAVAAAYRTSSVRTVAGDSTANGAVVAPIVSPGGCLGVLAAEIRRGGEHHEAIKALTLVFASQLGTLVSSAPADSGISQAQA